MHYRKMSRCFDIKPSTSWSCVETSNLALYFSSAFLDNSGFPVVSKRFCRLLSHSSCSRRQMEIVRSTGILNQPGKGIGWLSLAADPSSSTHQCVTLSPVMHMHKLVHDMHSKTSSTIESSYLTIYF